MDEQQRREALAKALQVYREQMQKSGASAYLPDDIEQKAEFDDQGNLVYRKLPGVSQSDVRLGVRTEGQIPENPEDMSDSAAIFKRLWERRSKEGY